MSGETESAAPLAAAKQHATFFRQSGWMMITTVVSGVLMSLVHSFWWIIPEAEYSAMGTLFQLLTWMTLPVVGLQMTVAQQTSAAVTEAQHRQLAGTFRAMLVGTFGIWLVVVLITTFRWQSLVTSLRLSNPAALGVTLVVALMMLWQPIFMGLLQGRQNFFWLGWVNIFNGIGRLVIAGLIVKLLGGQAAGIMVGALIGLIAVIGAGAWQNRDLWRAASERFDARGWWRRILPLTLGIGASQFLFSADLIVVQKYLGSDGHAAPYVFGGTLARAIVFFTAPLAAVMFPKLVHSAARAQKTNLLGVTMLGTAVLGVFAIIGLSIVAPYISHYLSKPEFVVMAPLMPLFASGMLMFALGNVLLNHLMAHSLFKAVPFLAALGVGYWYALSHFHDSFKTVVQVFTLFTLLYLLICAAGTWLEKGSRR